MARISIIIVVLVLVAAFIRMIAVDTYEGRLYASWINLALKEDNITPGTEELLRENSPVSFTARRIYWISPLYYTVIPSSEFNTLKETF